MRAFSIILHALSPGHGIRKYTENTVVSELKVREKSQKVK